MIRKVKEKGERRKVTEGRGQSLILSSRTNTSLNCDLPNYELWKSELLISPAKHVRTAEIDGKVLIYDIKDWGT